VNLGKVQEINETSFIIEKGTKNREKFYIPRSIPHAYNGSVTLLDITEDEVLSENLSPPATLIWYLFLLLLNGIVYSFFRNNSN
jgi:hypothetical protein